MTYHNHTFDYVNALVHKRDAMECRRLARMYKAWGYPYWHRRQMHDAVRAWRKYAYYTRRLREENRRLAA